jgi:hypothetical protein
MGLKKWNECKIEYITTAISVTTTTMQKKKKTHVPCVISIIISSFTIHHYYMNTQSRTTMNAAWSSLANMKTKAMINMVNVRP